MLQHLSLFSGIGGFDLAAEWSGIRNVATVENDPFCQQILKLRFPSTLHYADIKTFPADEFAGRIDIISGGFPCQPFSQAGKRFGTSDSRHLWPEMLRIIQVVKPSWVIAENVRGLLTIEGGLVFEQVCTDLEGEGYEVQSFIIPAVAVNAPHRRDRVWVIAHSPDSRTQNLQKQEISSIPVTDSQCPGREREEYQEGQGAGRYCWVEQWGRDWQAVAAELCSVDDGLPAELGKFKLSESRHKAEQIKSYGNAIVPQIAYHIFVAILKIHSMTC